MTQLHILYCQLLTGLSIEIEFLYFVFPVIAKLIYSVISIRVIDLARCCNMVRPYLSWYSDDKPVQQTSLVDGSFVTVGYIF